jgi:hypothetical protein
MMLEEAIDGLKKSLAKANISGEFGAKTADEVKAENRFLPLSGELITYFRLFATSDIRVPWSVEDLTLNSSATLFTHQVGYRYMAGDESGHIIDGWDANWIVIADKSADPVIAHSDKTGTPISVAVHGVGFWKPEIVAPSLSIFLQMLSIWVDIGVVKYAGNVFDEQSHFLPEVAADLRNALSKVIDDEQLATIFEYIGVWPL